MAEKKKNTDSVLLGAAAAASGGIAATKYENEYSPSANVLLSETKKKAAESAVANYGDFSYGKQSAYDRAMDAILNRKGFSYDLNGDALYQQYKDRYATQGKQASMDVMGQAAAMTGGYGSSYAQTVGQQAYQGYLQGLNDKVPELYQMALNRYNAEGERLATNYGLLASDRANALSEHESKYNKLVADRDYYGDNYDAEFNREYSMWNNDRNYATQQEQIAYQKEQDAIANNLAVRQLDESIRANRVSESLAREQWNYQKNQPAAIDYAITNYSDIPSNVIKKLDEIVSTKIDYLQSSNNPNDWFKSEDIADKHKETMKEKVSTYISGLVNSQQMSPSLGNALMEEYVALIDKKK